MAPAPTLDDDDVIARLELAVDELFYAHGVANVTVADVRDRSGVSLRRIYSLCSSKADLVSLWLRARHRSWSSRFADAVDASLANGRAPVDAVFDALEAWMVDTEFRGCGFINTHAELRALTDEHLEIIREHKRAFASYLDAVVGHGDELIILVDGAIVHAAMFESVEPIHAARRVAHALVDDSKVRTAK